MTKRMFAVAAMAALLMTALMAQAPTAPTKIEGEYTTTKSGLKYFDLKVGTGLEAARGDTVQVHYTGWLENGTRFDSSLLRGKPLPFTVGEGMVIKGWEEGVKGMKVGGKRQLVIPPKLGYGREGAGRGVIPPNATLIFEIELLNVRSH